MLAIKNKEQGTRNKRCVLLFALCSLLFALSSSPARGYDPAAIPQLDNPLQLNVSGADQSATKKISAYAGGGIQVVLSIVGSISLVMFIYAGVRYMLARGNAEEAKAAGKIMVWAALGLAMIFSSYVILQFIFSTLTG